jgi:hypothetical protein
MDIALRDIVRGIDSEFNVRIGRVVALFEDPSRPDFVPTATVATLDGDLRIKVTYLRVVRPEYVNEVLLHPSAEA